MILRTGISLHRIESDWNEKNGIVPSLLFSASQTELLHLILLLHFTDNLWIIFELPNLVYYLIVEIIKKLTKNNYIVVENSAAW